MTDRFVQVRDGAGARRLVRLRDSGPGRVVAGVTGLYDLANRAMAAGCSLAAAAETAGFAEELDVGLALALGRVLAPIDHPDPAHLHLTGTGLTHLGSAEGRDKMHREAAKTQTDSMRMFLMGVEGGKPAAGEAGVQPEWFYKGDGDSLVGPGAPLTSPDFALDAGEEPEIAGVYVIDPAGRPRRLGFCLANEFSDHVTERGNYLWLAHSKLRPAALGPELLTGDLPPSVQGVSRIRRGNEVVWEKPFLTGEDNMSHAIANLERHHFKYALFRRPGDVHVHFFGTATLSFSEGVKVLPGDQFEIAAPPFRFPARNAVAIGAEPAVTVEAL